MATDPETLQGGVTPHLIGLAIFDGGHCLADWTWLTLRTRHHHKISDFMV